MYEIVFKCILIAFCSASLSMLFQQIMKPGMILHKWINVLCWLYNNDYKAISKVLGLCYLCNSFCFFINNNVHNI